MKTTLATIILSSLFFFACKKSDSGPTGPVIGPPTVITTPITGFTPGFAYGGGNVTADNGAQVSIKGVAWSTTPNQSFALCNQTIDGQFNGAYSSKMYVSPATTYFVRAYAANNKGYGFGQEITFTTP